MGPLRATRYQLGTNVSLLFSQQAQLAGNQAWLRFHLSSFVLTDTNTVKDNNSIALARLMPGQDGPNGCCEAGCSANLVRIIDQQNGLVARSRL